MEVNYDPRLAPIVGDNLEINLIELGRIEQKHRCRPGKMTRTERDVRDAALELEGAARLFTSAVIHYDDYLDAMVRQHGGTIVRERIHHGRVVSRTVERYKSRGRKRNHAAPRSGAGQRRPAATRMTASSSSNSLADPGDPEPRSSRDAVVA